MSVKDLSPSFSLKKAKDEIIIPEDFKETPLQNMGGLQAGSRELTHGKIRIAGIDERIYFGDATDFSTGKGIIMGKRMVDDKEYYDFRFGDPDNDYIRWNEETGELLVSSKIIAGSGSDVDWSYLSNVKVKNIHIAETLTVSNTAADVTQTQLDAGASIDDAKANGSTFIQGGYIRTGIIDAGRIDTGVLNAARVNIGSTTDFDADYDPSTKLEDSDVGSLADYDLVETAMEDETIIVGGYVDTSYLTADNITTGTLTAITMRTDTSGNSRAELRDTSYSDYANELVFLNSSDTLQGRIQQLTNGISIFGNEAIHLDLSTGETVMLDSGQMTVGLFGDPIDLIPGTSGEELGLNSYKWEKLYLSKAVRFDYESDTYISHITDGGSSYIRLKFNSGGGDIEAGRTFKPYSDDTYNCGTSFNRWADVRSVLINGSDIGFENDWKFREYPASNEDIGKKGEWFKENANKGIQLIDNEGNVIAVFHKNGTLYCDDIKPLSELSEDLEEIERKNRENEIKSKSGKQEIIEEKVDK